MPSTETQARYDRGAKTYRDQAFDGLDIVKRHDRIRRRASLRQPARHIPPQRGFFIAQNKGALSHICRAYSLGKRTFSRRENGDKLVHKELHGFER